MIARRKAEFPFLSVLFPLVIGIAGTLWLPLFIPSILLYTILALALGSFIILNSLYRKLKLYSSKQWISGSLLIIILFISGYLLASQANVSRHQHFFAKQKAEQLLLQIDDEPKQSGNYILFVSNVQQTVNCHKSQPATGKLLIMMPATRYSQNLNYGDQLLVPADYAIVAAPYNPAEFNYKQYLASQNIYHQAFINPGHFVVIKKDAGNPIIAFSMRLRRVLVARLQAGISDSTASAVASTLMLGYKANLSPDILQAYAKTGTLHVLSVSGAHVAVIYALINLCIGFLSRYRYGRWLKALLTIFLIWNYALLTGFSPAVCRASVMLSFFIAGKTLYRHTSAINILAASALLLLLYQPLLLADAGFQLSYCAVLGLFVVQPIIFKQWNIKHKWPRKLWYLCSVSLAAQLTTLPLSIYYFHQFPVYFLISNLLIVIPAELIIIIGGAYLILYPVHAVAAPFAVMLQFIITCTNNSLLFLEHLPFAGINGIWITANEIAIFFVLIISGVWYLHQRKSHLLFSFSACVFILFVFTAYKDYSTANRNSIIFFDLKKETTILLKCGKNAVVLTNIDSAGRTYNYSIQPCVDSNRINCYNFVSLHSNFRNTFFAKAGNYIQFQNKSILLIDSVFRYHALKRQIPINYLYITDNVNIPLNLLARSYVYDTVIAGAGLSKQAIYQIESDARLQHKKFISLKRNKVFIAASN